MSIRILSVCLYSRLSFPVFKALLLCAVISSLRGSTISFHIISYTARFSGGKKKVAEHKTCVLIFSTDSSETFLTPRTIQRDIVINIHNTSSCKVGYPLFLSAFNETWILSTDFPKILKYQIPWKFVQWEPSCSMRTGRRRDTRDEANSRFSRFCELAKELNPVHLGYG